MALQLESRQQDGHFTFMILTLRPEHSSKLGSDSGRSLTRKLANIYHYYACPETFPDFPSSEMFSQVSGR